jgi:hypothetical protein
MFVPSNYNRLIYRVFDRTVTGEPTSLASLVTSGNSVEFILKLKVLDIISRREQTATLIGEPESTNSAPPPTQSLRVRSMITPRRRGTKPLRDIGWRAEGTKALRDHAVLGVVTGE